jgi:hypothetical protein
MGRPGAGLLYERQGEGRTTALIERASALSNRLDLVQGSITDSRST